MALREINNEGVVSEVAEKLSAIETPKPKGWYLWMHHIGLSGHGNGMYPSDVCDHRKPLPDNIPWPDLDAKLHNLGSVCDPPVSNLINEVERHAWSLGRDGLFSTIDLLWQHLSPEAKGRVIAGASEKRIGAIYDVKENQPPFSPLRFLQRRPQAPQLKSKFLAATQKQIPSSNIRENKLPIVLSLSHYIQVTPVTETTAPRKAPNLGSTRSKESISLLSFSLQPLAIDHVPRLLTTKNPRDFGTALLSYFHQRRFGIICRMRRDR